MTGTAARGPAIGARRRRRRDRSRGAPPGDHAGALAGLPVLGEKPVAPTVRRGAVAGRGRRGHRRAVHGQPVPPLQPHQFVALKAHARPARRRRDRVARRSSRRRTSAGSGSRWTTRCCSTWRSTTSTRPATCSAATRCPSAARRSTRPGAGTAAMPRPCAVFEIRRRRPVRLHGTGAARASRPPGTAPGGSAGRAGTALWDGDDDAGQRDRRRPRRPEVRPTVGVEIAGSLARVRRGAPHRRAPRRARCTTT